jgi:type II secretory pathway component GspD/PulD (secretin)
MGGGGGGMGGGGGGMGGGGGGGMQSSYLAYELSYIIQYTVEPESWYQAGGQGEIFPFSRTRLIVWQTPAIHKKIKDLIKKLRRLVGDQVAIETRFLVVDENFLEDIGLDTTIIFQPGRRWNSGGLVTIGQDSFNAAMPSATKISSSLGDESSQALSLSPVSYNGGALLDDLTVNFVLRATQMHANSKVLTAPKAMVLNGESASLSITQTKNYISNVEYNSEVVQFGAGAELATTVAYWTSEISQIGTGITLSFTPTITADKKYVLLMVITFLNDILSGGENEGMVQGLLGTDVVTNTFDLPQTQSTTLLTRVTVPDQGTVLLGGLTLTAQKEIQSGVPVLSKIPILGRLFENRSEVKDKQILLILVKPTIILKEEAEDRAVAAMEQD